MINTTIPKQEEDAGEILLCKEPSRRRWFHSFMSRSRVLGRGCEDAEISEEKYFSLKERGAFSESRL